ncbi:hypothetical protein GYN24_10490 [Lactococcus piscium]|uniref:Lipoprotein n=1 Tax=Pseudolactococcus paracarnosus TaxID=2749962 RepID=A0A7L4WDF3_9LACT|nr:hypothetical protein [Lactococcus paracarnosus]MCJ1995007.1 hypothetical protein [Lactococcus paracarnosus]QDJ28217.1 hypothetical protein BHS01_06640 [Lactococcus paracarnosus]SPC35384.1 hypothetical protein LPICM02_150032 [Lactococcus piscium]
MKKVIKISMLLLMLIVLSSCKKGVKINTKPAINEIYGYWIKFDTEDRRTNIDYSVKSEDVEKDKSLQKNHDGFADFSEENLKDLAKYGDRYRAKYVNNDIVCLREDDGEIIRYHYFKKIDSDTMISIILYDDPLINRYKFPDEKLLAISTKDIYKRSNKQQRNEFVSAMDSNDKFVIKEYDRIRKNTLNKTNLDFYRKNFSGWNQLITDNGKEDISIEYKSLYGKYSKVIIDDYRNNTKDK